MLSVNKSPISWNYSKNGWLSSCVAEGLFLGSRFRHISINAASSSLSPFYLARLFLW